MTRFHDYLQSIGATAVDKASRKDMGTLTLNQRARMITKISAVVTVVGTVAASKPCAGYITVTSEDCNIEPMEFPFAPTPSHLGSTPGHKVDEPYEFVINVPCPPGATLQFYMTLGVAAPNGAPEVFINVEYTDGESDGSPQMHIKMLEPSAALSTGDNDVTTLTAITIKGASDVVQMGFFADVATPVADEALAFGVKVTCDEFKVSGPEKWGLRGKPAGDATDSQASTGWDFFETNRHLSKSQADLVTEVIQYDANNAAPEIYVAVFYI